MAALAHRVPGKWRRPCRAVDHVPASGRPGQGGDRPRPRDRRPVHRRPGRRLARRRARPVRHPDAADAGALRPVRVGGPRAARALVRRPRRAARRHPPRPVLPACRGDQRAAAADRRAARRSGSAARSGAASRSPRPSRDGLGACRPSSPSARPSDLDYFSEQARRGPRRAGRRSGATRRASTSSPRFRPGPRPRTGAWALGPGAATRSGVAPPTSSSGCRPRLGPAGVDRVAAEVAQPAPRRAGSMTARRRHDPAGRHRGRPRGAHRDRQRRHPGRPDCRSTRSAGPTRPIPARRGSWRRVDERVVGAATVGRIYIYPPEYPDLWASLVVEPEARRRGHRWPAAGRRIRRTRATPASAASSCAPGTTGRRASSSWSIAGFVEFERARMVRLELAGLEAPPVAAPPGIDPDDARGAARPRSTASTPSPCEAFDDIPGGDEPMAAGDLAEFRARDVDRPGIRHDAFMIAIDDADRRGRRLRQPHARPRLRDRGLARHDRGRVAHRADEASRRSSSERPSPGRSTTACTALDTGNDEENAPMRAVNAAARLPAVARRGDDARAAPRTTPVPRPDAASGENEP